VSNEALHTYKNRMFREHIRDAWDSGWYEECTLQPHLQRFQNLQDRDVRDAWVFHVLTSLPRYTG